MQSNFLLFLRNLKLKMKLMVVIVACGALFLIGCTPLDEFAQDPNASPVANTYNAPVYLYGEQHGVKGVLEKELELWDNYYHNQNMRYLFIELPHYTAQFLNLWMQADDDTILDQIFDDIKGTASDKPIVKDFYKTFKMAYPETVFIGTDVGHQYETTGARYLKYLEGENLQDTEDYILTLAAIEQGREFYKKEDAVYRENMMAENFMVQYIQVHLNNLGKDLVGIMGIYGAAHTGIEAMDFTNSVASMANQLVNTYQVALTSTDLSVFAKIKDPESVEPLELAGRIYQASYFGTVDMTGFKDYSMFRYYRIESAYEDFKDIPQANDYLPCSQYPMVVAKGQVLMVETTKKDGTVETFFYRTDGEMLNGIEISRGFKLK